MVTHAGAPVQLGAIDGVGSKVGPVELPARRVNHQTCGIPAVGNLGPNGRPDGHLDVELGTFRGFLVNTMGWFDEFMHQRVTAEGHIGWSGWSGWSGVKNSS